VAAAPPTTRANPATGAKEAAMKMYPALAVKDSTFNKTFRDLYLEKSQKDPDFLTRADWPLVLARQTADLLFVQPATSATPPPAAPQAIAVASATDASGHSFKPTPGPNALDRGAYNRGYSHWYYWNGRYYSYSPPNTPSPAAAAPLTSGDPTPAPNALDKGAYNQTHTHYWWPWTRYYYP